MRGGGGRSVGVGSCVPDLRPLSPRVVVWVDGGGAVLRMASCSVCPSMCDLWFCGVSMLGKVLGLLCAWL